MIVVHQDLSLFFGIFINILIDFATFERNPFSYNNNDWCEDVNFDMIFSLIKSLWIEFLSSG